MKMLLMALSILAVLVLGTMPVSAAEEDVAAELEKLQQLLEQLTEIQKMQVEKLLERIDELEARLESMTEQAADDELAAIMAEAEELTREQVEIEEQAEAGREHFGSRQRTLQNLNPEIGFLGDFTYDQTSGAMKDGFLVRGVELAFQSVLDPYTRFKGMLAGHQEPFELEIFHDEAPGEVHDDEIHVGVEEAYMEWVALPLNTRLRVGRFRQQFGTLNRWHQHALPVIDSPQPLQNLFGHEGLVGLGVGFDWELPSLWATHNGLTLEVVNADNPIAFAGSEWDDPSYLLRHTGFFDINPDTYFEVGLNVAFGPNGETETTDTTVASVDFNFLWEPTGRAHYRSIELRGEYLHAEFDTAGAGTIDSDGFYSYLSYKLARRWTAGLGYEFSELPADRFELLDPGTLEEMEFTEGLAEKNMTAFLTYWQSEFVRLRLQYRHSDRDYVAAWGEDGDDRISLQVTFAAGPHKHESY